VTEVKAHTVVLNIARSGSSNVREGIQDDTRHYTNQSYLSQGTSGIHCYRKSHMEATITYA